MLPVLILAQGHAVLDSNLFRPAHFLTDKLLTWVWLYDILTPPTEIYKFFNSFYYMQNCTFSLARRHECQGKEL